MSTVAGAAAVGLRDAALGVELGNDGAEPVDLLDLVLLDGVERVPLPSLVLAPGALALVVAVGFKAGLAGDASRRRARRWRWSRRFL